MNFKNTFILLAIVAIAIFSFTILSEEGEARLCVWDGDDAGALASSPANWDSDTAPVAGDDILFDGLHLVNASADDVCQWDISTIVNDILIESSYSGTFEAVTWVKLTGNFTSPVGKINYAYSSIWMLGDEKTFSYPSIIQGLRIGANVTASSFMVYNLIIDSGKTLTLGGNVDVFTWDRWDGSFCNHGTVTGDYLFTFNVVTAFNYNIDLNNFTSSLDIKLLLQSGASGNSVLTSISNIQCYNFTIVSETVDKTITLNLNGYPLTATTITVGAGGILDCGNGTITCSALTSTSGTIIEDTATWIFNSGAVVTATSGQKFYNVQMKGDCDFVSSVNVTNDLRFINVPVDYDDLDIYLDTVYSVTIPSPYTFGPEITAAAEYTYLPDVQISISQFYEDIDFSIYAYISTNIPATYNITGTASSWLSYHEGRIVGMPPDIGNYTYTITATNESTGSEDIINGYILVGSLSTAEYSFDMIWGLILWLVISAFMLLGLLLNIPLIQIVAFMGTIGSIVASLRIPNFEAFLMIFALGNSVLFFIGMIRYRR